jgi:hypothetical protein
MYYCFVLLPLLADALDLDVSDTLFSSGLKGPFDACPFFNQFNPLCGTPRLSSAQPAQEPIRCSCGC